MYSSTLNLHDHQFFYGPTSPSLNLKDSDVRALIKDVQEGNQNAEESVIKIFRNYKSLIYKIKSKYERFTTSTFDSDDLTSTIYIAIFRSIQLFDLSKKVKFLTYLFSSIQYQIWRAIETESRPLKLPGYIQRDIYKIKKYSNEIRVSEQREASTEEISTANSLSKERVEFLKSIPTIVYSLDEPLSFCSENTFLDTITSYDDNIDIVYRKIFRQELLTVLKEILTERVYLIVYLHYGLNESNKEGLNFSEISYSISITRERVRQIHNNAIKKIMNHENNSIIYNLLL